MFLLSEPDCSQPLRLQGRTWLGPWPTGPYKVLKKVGDLNYILSTPDRGSKTRLCYINALMAYEGLEVAVCSAVPEFTEEEEFGSHNPEVPSPPPVIVSARFCDMPAQEVLEANLQHLMETQIQDAWCWCQRCHPYKTASLPVSSPQKKLSPGASWLNAVDWGCWPSWQWASFTNICVEMFLLCAKISAYAKSPLDSWHMNTGQFCSHILT